MALIPLTQWAKKHNLEQSTARKKASRGVIPAVKMGRDWMIEEDVPNDDHRYGDLSRRWKSEK